MTEPDRIEPARHHGDFWSQVPVVLFTMAAVVAIFLVNHKTEAASAQVLPPAAATVEAKPAPVDCADCGEVIAIRPLAVEATDADAALPDGAVLLEVRMRDGTVRSIKQLPNGLDVGDRVQVRGDTLVARS